jgi:hypothetical protein
MLPPASRLVVLAHWAVAPAEVQSEGCVAGTVSGRPGWTVASVLESAWVVPPPLGLVGYNDVEVCDWSTWHV